MKSMNLIKFFILISISIYTFNSQSLFDSLNSNNVNVPTHQQPQNIQMSRNNPNKFQTLVESFKSRISNQELKRNFTAENVAGIFESLLTGNEFLKNIDVNELAIFDKLEINDLLKLKDTAQFEEISVKSSFKNNLLNITDDNEIIFEDEAVIRIKNSPIAFKAKDIFEVIAFLKFMMKMCGKQMERCDFNTLLKNSLNQQKLDLMKVLKDRFNKNKEDLAKIHAEHQKILHKRQEDSNSGLNNNSQDNRSNDAEITKKNLKPSSNQINKDNSSESSGRSSLANNFIFKEQNVHTNNSSKNLTQPDENKEKSFLSKNENEIEELLDYEFKFFKENSSVNEFENFYNNGLFQKYLAKYYYEGI